jgi:hypothetical protein
VDEPRRDEPTEAIEYDSSPLPAALAGNTLGCSPWTRLDGIATNIAKLPSFLMAQLLHD